MRTISGTSRTISEYFEDTLATEPPAVVDFLLKTSILDQMNGSLCSAVAGTADGASILEALEREQFLLVPLDEHGHWYRYHHLLREFLVDRLRTKMGEQIQELIGEPIAGTRRASMWSEAVHYAIAAGDFPLAIEFIENCAMSMVVKGDLLTLLSWEQQLPKELMSSPARGQAGARLGHEPRHPLQGGGRSARAGRGRSAGDARQRPVVAVPRRARGVLRARATTAPAARTSRLECLAGHRFDAFNFNALCNVARYAYLKAGDWNAFYAVPKPDASAGEASYVLPENYRLCLYGLAAVKQLKFEEALEFYAAAQALAEKYAGAKSVSASMLTGLIARLQYERGDVTGAEVTVLDALDLIETTAFHEGFRNAYFVLVRAAAIRGDRARAMSLLNRAERLSWERGWGVVIAMLLVERTRLLLADGNIAEAIALLPAFEELHAKHPAGSSCSSTPIRTWNMVAKGLIDAAYGQSARTPQTR